MYTIFFIEKNMNLEEIKESWESDSKINVNNIALESIKCSSLHAKYINEITSHKQRIIKLQNDYNLEKKFKMRFYKGELTKEELDKRNMEQYQGRKLLKDELESFIIGDEDIQLINIKIEYTKVCVYLLEGIIKNIYSRTYEIKNFIEYKKFESGF